MNKQILNSISSGELILFLGAGASYGCERKLGGDILMPSDLAPLLAEKAGLQYDKESLDVVYEAARDVLGVGVDEILTQEYRHVTPSKDYEALSRYAWRRIYTLNIDDGLDRALERTSPQAIRKFLAGDQIESQDPFFETLDYIKLNGSSDKLNLGIIFSPSEYAQATAAHLPWYSQCSSDFVRSPILFIGTQLNEPLLKFHIERYQQLNPSPLRTSYLIAKSATEIQVAALKRYKIEFIQGTMSDLTKWLFDNLPSGILPKELAAAQHPQLSALLNSANKKEFVSLFDHVERISQDSSLATHASPESSIRNFYKGFRPTWQEIADGVPAHLDVFPVMQEKVLNTSADDLPLLLPVIGPAGSGKTTLLMQTTWSISNEDDWTVYFLDAEPTSLIETLVEIERTSKTPRVLVALDNIGVSLDSISFALKSERLTKTVLIGAERENIWARRGKVALKDLFGDPLYMRDFSEDDAKKILTQLKRYGSWTRLGKMSDKSQIKELVSRAKKQLLIALMEATLGRGFEEIIESEYVSIESDEEKLFLATVAIITDRRFDAPIPLLDRALEKMSILRSAVSFVDDLTGLVHVRSSGVTARHPVYAKYLIERVIDRKIIAQAINSILQAFADYKAPVIQNIPKNEASIYKSLINHQFLYSVLQGSEHLVIDTYRRLEKKFESDGLFWLQYGLALRDFKDTPGALEKLRIAGSAYPMPHTLHALAQQLLLSASESDSKPTALGLASEARVILEKLDDVYESDDTYPIVTLAEGYTQVLRKHATQVEAMAEANRFSVILGHRSKNHAGNDRLRVSYERLLKYAATGVWQPLKES